MRRSLVWVLLVLMASFDALADETPTMNDTIYCGVYYRMVAGSLSARFGSGRETLAAIEKEKMQTMIKRGRRLAVGEYGEELAKELFDEQWRDVLQEMTDDINRNYDNVSRKLKYRYGSRCSELLETLNRR